MKRVTAELRDSLIAGLSREALHLEMRDLYAAADHGRFRTWLAGEPRDPAAEEEWWRPWREMMRGHREAGRTLRRLRVVSEPVTEYIRFEWRDADELVKAGEDVRWLPRQRASALFLPGNDLWSFDAETVVFTHLSGDGTIQGYELSRDPAQPVHAVLTVTTPVQQAREALGACLREIRKDANLTARALAVAMGSHFTKVSKIENGARSPTEEDIRSWCTACGAAGHVPDLIASVRHIEPMYKENRRKRKAGLKHLMESSVPLYEQTSLFRIYDTTVVPGLFTTAEYAAALFRF